MTEQIYMENIIDHFKHPRNYGRVERPDASHHDNNPLCGDDIEITIKVADGKVADVKFQGHGCAISQASASMLTEKLKGMSLEEAKKTSKDEIFELLGINLSPIRIKCALLPLQAMTAAISKYKFRL
ncbi:MAG TPA: SUF system NifU family Fe-S cluster assembly protein [Candidatus Nanoarchaeia archaeon]|nr:SUF system NifU family Fe-S cluster assembly protein [Candidatus Nanoarchaeia archaeon]